MYQCERAAEHPTFMLQVMAPNRKIYALKRIKLQGRDAEAATGFIDEITLLQALRGKQNIIQLVDAEARSQRQLTQSARLSGGPSQTTSSASRSTP